MAGNDHSLSAVTLSLNHKKSFLYECFPLNSCLGDLFLLRNVYDWPLGELSLVSTHSGIVRDRKIWLSQCDKSMSLFILKAQVVINRAAAVVRLSEKSICILCSSFQLSTSFKLETTHMKQHTWNNRFTFGFGKTTYSIRIMPSINQRYMTMLNIFLARDTMSNFKLKLMPLFTIGPLKLNTLI